MIYAASFITRDVFTVIGYAYILGCTILIALPMALALCLLVRRTLHVGVAVFFKRFYLLALALLCAGSLWICYHPVFTADEESRQTLSQEELQRWRRRGAGFYTARLPMFPLLVQLQTFPDTGVHRLTIYYAYAGTYAIEDGDGLACVKPLF